jgi:hypothetical protein
MTQNGMYELIRDEDGELELVATGTAEQMAADRLELIEENAELGESTTYRVVPADLTGCEIGARGGICPASTHALH